jgi:hypothetical protein
MPLEIPDQIRQATQRNWEHQQPNRRDGEHDAKQPLALGGWNAAPALREVRSVKWHISVPRDPLSQP